LSEKTVAQKLLIKEGCRILFLNAPKGYNSLLGKLPEDVVVLKQPSEPVDLIQFFAMDRKTLEEQLPQFKPLLRPGGLLWVTYPKGSSKLRADINRDSINAFARTLGLQGVAMIAIDADWSALRLKAI
jgi:hypothetical protein